MWFLGYSHLRETGFTVFTKTRLKYDKQDQQGKAAFNKRNPHMTQWQGAQADPKQKQDRANTEHGQVNH
jgi:hypothetical protein